MKPLRWGILGAANIARKNWKGIALSGNSVLTAVASRDLDKSKRFIADCYGQMPTPAPPKPLGSYEALLASENVDAVYIPLPTALRKEWVLRAAAAGKHVLCEKPCAVTLGDLREMTDACRRNNVQFLDGVMFMHTRRLQRVREMLDDGQSVGPLRRLTSAFSFGAPPEFLAANIRGDSRLEPHGCLGDLGWYCIRLSLWAMNWQMPKTVAGRLLSSAGDVPTEFSGELIFDGNVSANFYCSFITANQEWANLSGARGYLQIPDFVLPFAGGDIKFTVFNHTFSASGCDFKMEPNPREISVREHSHSEATAQESNMFRAFADQVNSGKLNEDWPKWALRTQEVMCSCLEAARRA
jgi:predicted dehydrogenase